MSIKERYINLIKIIGMVVIPAVFLLFTAFAVLNKELNLSKTFESQDSKASTAAPLKAFPSAEGFGAQSVGGRGGKVYEVTNLNDDGEGSLRYCINDAKKYGARTCIFKVGGSITLNSSLNISAPYITIAGQTAPGGGILLRRNGGTGDVINISTHDVIVRYLTLRRGPPTNVSDVNALSIYKNDSVDLYNVVIDHCSMSWTNDRILFSWYGPHDFTIQWSLFTEPLSCNKNTKGCVEEYGAKSVMLGSGVVGEGNKTPGSGAKNISFHHNLISHGGERNPLVKPAGFAEIINNVVYNVGHTYAHMDADLQIGQNFPINFIGNYFKTGPQGSSIAGIKLSMTGSVVPEVYVENNISSKRDGISLVNEELVLDKSKSYIVYSPPHAKNPSNPQFPIAIDTCNSDPTKGGTCDAYNKVVIQALAGNNRGIDENGSLYTRQDAVDKRIMAEVINKQGKIIDAPGVNTCWSGDKNPCTYLTAADYTKYGIAASDVDFSDSWFNGWPIIANGIGYTDSDHDGMPDTWELSHSLDPNNATDANNVAASGYTWLEEYLNGSSTTPSSPTTVPSVLPTVLITAAPQPTSTPIPLPTSTPAILITPTQVPTIVPSIAPSAIPSTVPTVTPSVVPSVAPTEVSVVPSAVPTIAVSSPLLSPIMGEYFNNKTLSGNPVFFRYDTAVNFDWGYNAPSKSLPKDQFSVRWSKEQYFNTGKYTVNVTSDDGIRIYYDGTLIYSSWKNQWAIQKTFTLNTQAGIHKIRIEYFENYGRAKVKVNWKEN